MGNKQRLRAERRRLDGQNLSVKFSVTGDDDPEGVEVALDGAALDPPTHSADDGIAVDLTPAPAPAAVPDDADDDDPAGDPFAELQRQYEEAKSARDAAEARAKEKETAEARYRVEAEQARGEREATDARLRDEQKRRDELEAFRIKAEREQLVSHKAVLEGALERAEAQRIAAQRAYSEAMASGDYDRAGEAQAAISDAVFERRRYAEGLDRLKEQIEAPLPEYTRAPEPERPVHQQPVSDPFDTWVAQANIPESDKAYLRQRKDFIQAHPDNGDILQSAARLAEKRYKLTPGTDEYHRFLDEQIGMAEQETLDEVDPEPRASTPPAVPAASRQPSKRPTAAPASRATASNQSTKVFLTDWDRDQAKQLKMSDRDYAAFKLKSTEGQLSQAQAGGRLMARYSAD